MSAGPRPFVRVELTTAEWDLVSALRDLPASPLKGRLEALLELGLGAPLGHQVQLDLAGAAEDGGARVADAVRAPAGARVKCWFGGDPPASRGVRGKM